MPSSPTLLALLAALSLAATPHAARAQTVVVPPAGAAPATADPASAPPPPADDPGAAVAVRIVYDGDTGGVSSGLADLGDAELLEQAAREAGREVASRQATLGALYRDRLYLWADGEPTLSAADAFLAAPPFEPAAPPVRLWAVDGPDSVLLAVPVPGPPPGPPAPAAHPLLARAARESLPAVDAALSAYRNAGGAVAWVLDLAPDRAAHPLDAPADDWEVRERVSLSVAGPPGAEEWALLAKRVGEGSRRKALIEAELAAGGAAALYVSAGGSVEGRSFLPGRATSMQRPLSFRAYAATGLRHLSPSLAELVPGPEALSAEAEAAGIGLLSCNLSDLQGNILFAASAVHPAGGRRVAFVGVTDPGIWPLLDPAVRARVQVLDPVASVERAVAGLDADLVVVLTSMDGGALAHLASRVRGVDVVLADFGSGLRGRREERVVPAPGRARDPGRRPLLVARASGAVYGVVTAGFGPGGALAALSHRVEPVPQEAAPDPGPLREVNAIRREVYRRADTVLVPDLAAVLPPAAAGAPPPRLDYRRWMNLASNLVRRRTAADVVLLPPLPWPFDLTGPTRELPVLASLAVPDRLVAVHVPGATLRRLLVLSWSAEGAAERGSDFGGDTRTRAGRAEPSVAGAEVGDRDIAAWKVRGVAISDAETYRLVLTDHLATRPDFARALAGLPVRSRFAPGPAGALTPVPVGGAEVALRDAVLDALTRMRDDDPTLSARYRARLLPLLSQTGGSPEPALVLRVQSAAFRLLWNRAFVDRDAYADVAEPRASASDSLDLGWNVQASASLEETRVNWVTSVLGVYTQSRVEGAEPTETQDDLQVATELQVKPPDVRVGRGVSLWPIANLTYDTVFDLRRDDDPRQRVLRGAAGVQVLKLWKPLPSLRLAAFAEHDLSVLEDPHWKAGLTAALVHEWPLRPVKWRTEAIAYYWFPIPSQDRSGDLSYSVGVKSTLSVPLAGPLQVSTWADALLFRLQGQGGDAPPPGLSLILGVDLGFAGTLRHRL